jgi:uncharacterized protein (DUF934 family)
MRNVVSIAGGKPEVIEDDWVLVTSFAEAQALDEETRPVVPLALLKGSVRENTIALAANGVFGLLLEPSDDPADALPLFGSLGIIAVNFPQAVDGRGYSCAALLRTRHGWQGELRAVGDVLRDQLFYLKRVGFTSFAIREDRSAEDAIAALADFSGTYQTSVA